MTLATLRIELQENGSSPAIGENIQAKGMLEP